MYYSLVSMKKKQPKETDMHALMSKLSWSKQSLKQELWFKPVHNRNCIQPFITVFLHKSFKPVSCFSLKRKLPLEFHEDTFSRNWMDGGSTWLWLFGVIWGLFSGKQGWVCWLHASTRLWSLQGHKSPWLKACWTVLILFCIKHLGRILHKTKPIFPDLF